MIAALRLRDTPRGSRSEGSIDALFVEQITLHDAQSAKSIPAHPFCPGDLDRFTYPRRLNVSNALQARNEIA